MFCKYCGGSINGTTCSKCGKASVLFAHSTELENLLEKNTAPNQKTFDEGFSKGYQKGLAEGYQNGINEPKEPPIVEYGPKPVNRKLIAVLCGIVFAIGALLSGFIANRIGYRTGYTKGTSEGEKQVAAMRAEFDSKYEDAKNEGIKEGENNAKKDYELELARLKETTTPSPAPIFPSTEETPAPDNQIIFSKKTTESIKKIQKRLLELGYHLKGKDDGIYGSGTENAVRQFQEEMHISPVSGEVDLQTYKALFPELFLNANPDREEKPDSIVDQDTPDPTVTGEKTPGVDEKPAGSDEEPAGSDEAGSDDEPTGTNEEPAGSDEEPAGNEEGPSQDLLTFPSWSADMTFD